jgi:hypothetical protein
MYSLAGSDWGKFLLAHLALDAGLAVPVVFGHLGQFGFQAEDMH